MHTDLPLESELSPGPLFRLWFCFGGSIIKVRRWSSLNLTYSPCDKGDETNNIYFLLKWSPTINCELWCQSRVVTSPLSRWLSQERKTHPHLLHLGASNFLPWDINEHITEIGRNIGILQEKIVKSHCTKETYCLGQIANCHFIAMNWQFSALFALFSSSWLICWQHKSVCFWSPTTTKHRLLYWYHVTCRDILAPSFKLLEMSHAISRVQGDV